jgi:hypothetical protein
MDRISEVSAGGRGAAEPHRASWLVEGGVLWIGAMSHQYKPGDVVTVFQISRSKELVIEGKATVRKRLQMLMSSTGSSSPISQA